MTRLDELVEAVARALSGARIPYVIVGGVAVAAYGRVRATLDVDLILDLKPGDAPGLVLALRGAGLDVTAADVVDALRDRGHFTVFVPGTEYRLDCKGAYGEKERESLRLRRRRKLGDTWIMLDSIENLIAHKLLFGSEQDREDAESVYVRQRGGIDLLTLEERAAALGVMKELRDLTRRVETTRP